MPKILVVDDDSSYLEVIEDLLKEANYEVQTCSDPTQAVHLAETSQCQCVLLDYHMPKLDGQDVLRLVHTKHPDLPVIMCSGYLRTKESEFIREGAFDILHKPFDYPVLFDSIHRALASEDEDKTMIPLTGYDLRAARELVTRKMIIKALTKTDFNITRAAALLGISRQYLLRYTKRYEINT